eukprot:Phypoly_transcript_16991.p1 GENE.Phypoly_transcript_16991~~Phypoly_transcript_16991.p1  ORF type:complete len:196 (+),score=9.41 Phypoly_transcript_16991:36-590(+)
MALHRACSITLTKGLRVAPAFSHGVLQKHFSASINISGVAEGDIRPALLEESLKHVPKLGWSLAAISAGAKDMNLPGISHGLFPKGAFELVQFFITKTNKQLATDFSSRDLSNQNQREKISSIIKARLMSLAPYVKSGRWSEALSTLAHPSNVPQSLHMLAVLVDEMWYHAGDTSTDVRKCYDM